MQNLVVRVQGEGLQERPESQCGSYPVRGDGEGGHGSVEASRTYHRADEKSYVCLSDLPLTESSSGTQR